MVGDRTKKQKLTENPEEVDAELILSIEKLQEIQDDLEKINDEASDKVLEIEQKYNEIRKPVYDKRNEIIKSIPDFWLNAFLSHPTLSELLNDEDQKIFKYLSSLEVEDNKDVKSGYTITLNFNPNPYFEDSKLSKTFTFREEGTTEITATPIKWKEGKGIPNGDNHEKKGNKRPPVDVSFLSWFCDCEQKDDMADIHDELAELIKMTYGQIHSFISIVRSLMKRMPMMKLMTRKKMRTALKKRMTKRVMMRKAIENALWQCDLFIFLV
uniref:Nucleosome assembly protein (NAP) n=1 Tax=Medicago truncatula TaxID=3880 RepID=B7FI46_MEDTR|nr:unknown [Medicago truncatula]